MAESSTGDDVAEEMELVAKLVVPGEPKSKARPKFTTRGGKVVAYTPKDTQVAEAKFKAAYLEQMKDVETNDQAAFVIHATFYNGTRQRRDVDNMLKAVLDGLNKTAFPDDVQVIEVVGRKVYVGKEGDPRTEVFLYRNGEMGAPHHPCETCGKLFKTYDSWMNRKRFCSKACGDESRRLKRLRTCKQCGEKFENRQANPEYGIYCSRDCSSEAKRANLKCDHCNSEFTKQRCLVRKKNYCSDECMRAARSVRRKSRMVAECQDCGGGVTRKEYKRCNSCRISHEKVMGKPRKKSQ